MLDKRGNRQVKYYFTSPVNRLYRQVTADPDRAEAGSRFRRKNGSGDEPAPVRKIGKFSEV
jgi:hypothetical protein